MLTGIPGIEKSEFGEWDIRNKPINNYFRLCMHLYYIDSINAVPRKLDFFPNKCIFFLDWSWSDCWEEMGTKRRTVGIQPPGPFPLVSVDAGWPVPWVLWSWSACVFGLWWKNENQEGQRNGEFHSCCLCFLSTRKLTSS